MSGAFPDLRGPAPEGESRILLTLACQNKDCRERLAAVHMSSGILRVLRCPGCGRASEFIAQAETGYVGRLMPPNPRDDRPPRRGLDSRNGTT